MSMREEDREKKNCPSRGLGLAAAAIGVGVGAALYYFFSKRSENPDGEGSTSGWNCEQPHAFNLFHDGEEADTSMENQCNSSNTSLSTEGSDYTTISETTTTDTSVHDSSQSSTDSQWTDASDDENSYIDLIPEGDINDDLDIFNVQNFLTDYDHIPDEPFEIAEESDDEWDVTDSSMVPEGAMRESALRVTLSNIGTFFSPRVPMNRRRRRMTHEQERLDLIRARALSEEEQIKFLKSQEYRERSWSLEECSICFEIMLKDQNLTSLPCSHNFHSTCIAPWLAEQQTCPNCRKAAE